MGAKSFIVVTAAAAALQPGRTPDVPDRRDAALRQVVMVDGVESGAGIVIGHIDGSLDILTAAHVVGVDPTRAASVMIYPGQSKQLTGRLIPGCLNAADDDDWAVIRTEARPEDVMPWALALKWRILGDARGLEKSIDINAVGHGPERVWDYRQPPDKLFKLQGRNILFQSDYVKPGYSGGGVFDDDWRLVGLFSEGFGRGFETRAAHNIESVLESARRCAHVDIRSDETTAASEVVERYEQARSAFIVQKVAGFFAHAFPNASNVQAQWTRLDDALTLTVTTRNCKSDRVSEAVSRVTCNVVEKYSPKLGRRLDTGPPKESSITFQLVKNGAAWRIESPTGP